MDSIDREPWEWDESDLLSLIKNEVQESIGLDYKRCDALAKTDSKKKELSKDVSAFANSAGGVLVYGMIEDKHVPTAIDDGFDRESITKEWLDQVINSNIHRRIDGVRIKQVDLPSKGNGRVAYVIYVPQSDRAPHQASDHKFYRRYNFESISMEEYEIRDTSNRSIAPDLKLSIGLTVIDGSADEFQAGISIVLMTPLISNDAVTPAEYADINLFIDAQLPITNFCVDFGHQLDVERFVGEHAFKCQHLSLNWAKPRHLPIFSGVEFMLSPDPIRLRIREPGNYLFEWELFSPRMPKRGKQVRFHWDGTKDENKTITI